MLLSRRVPRPTENQGLFLFVSPNGNYRRMCHMLPPVLCCATDLTGTWGAYAGDHVIDGEGS